MRNDTRRAGVLRPVSVAPARLTLLLLLLGLCVSCSNDHPVRDTARKGAALSGPASSCAGAVPDSSAASALVADLRARFRVPMPDPASLGAGGLPGANTTYTSVPVIGDPRA